MGNDKSLTGTVSSSMISRIGDTVTAGQAGSLQSLTATGRSERVDALGS